MTTTEPHQPQDMLSSPPPDFIIIRGQTTDGKKFRPSDWCERLHSTLRALDAEDYEECVEYVHLINHNGGKCVLINHELEKVNGMLYKFFMQFVASNDLMQDHISRESWDSLHQDSGNETSV